MTGFEKIKFVCRLKILTLVTLTANLILVGCSGTPKKKVYEREPDLRPDYTIDETTRMKQEPLGVISERIGLIIAPGQFKDKAYQNSGYIQESFEIVLSAMDDKFDYVYSTPPARAGMDDNSKKIERCLKSCGKNTFLVAFIAGNVVSLNNRYFLLCYDTDPKNIAKTAIDLGSFFKKLDDAGCGRILVFADLYLQDKRPGKLIEYLSGLPAFKKQYDLSREMRMLVTSHSANDKTYRFYVGFQGADIFGWYLALGLREQADKVVNGGNDDGKTTSDELVRYIREELSGALIYKQRPTMIGNFSPETVVLK